jgi:hypothetical protein
MGTLDAPTRESRHDLLTLDFKTGKHLARVERLGRQGLLHRGVQQIPGSLCLRHVELLNQVVVTIQIDSVSRIHAEPFRQADAGEPEGGEYIRLQHNAATATVQVAWRQFEYVDIPACLTQCRSREQSA